MCSLPDPTHAPNCACGLDAPGQSAEQPQDSRAPLPARPRVSRHVGRAAPARARDAAPVLADGPQQAEQPPPSHPAPQALLLGSRLGGEEGGAAAQEDLLARADLLLHGAPPIRTRKGARSAEGSRLR
eukprot:2830997-Alexandrium_andersonii.AAC.1